MEEKLLTISYREYSSTSELSKEDQQLISQAEEAYKNAYAPYSHFHVGAVALLDNGKTVVGNNQENVAYPSGLCAERVALFSVGANYPEATVKTLAIAAKGDLVDKDAVLSPCGACRQVIFESEKRQNSPIRILVKGLNGKVVEFHKSTDLLTFAFGL